MSKFSAKMDKLGDSLKHKARIVDRSHMHMFKEQIKTTWNPNHRHDEEHEQEVDRQNQALRDRHRFNSFAPETRNSVVRSHVDGHDFFWAVSIMLEEAHTSIMILDWWLTPELYLRRPPAQHPEYRLDRLLKRKAEEGVKIYIVVYKEVTQTMSMSSSHTKHWLEDMHDNIQVTRHPDHMGGEVTLFWSHHEKMTIVDSTRATVGGLDLCFGRWDTHDHPLADVHPTSFHQTLFPGQDFNNARVMDFQNVDNFVSNAVDITRVARMPWHDTSMTMVGPAVIDLTQHFVERWNFIKHQKYKHDDRYDWLALPYPFGAGIDCFEDRRGDHTSEVENAERAERRREHPHLQEWLDKGRSFAHPYHFHPSTEPRAEEAVPKGTCNVQVVRSSGDWSHGILVEDSIQRAYCQMILEASHFIYIENQFFITNTVDANGPVINTVGAAIVNRVLSAARAGQKFKVIIMIPEIPAFPGDLSAEGGLKCIMGAQYSSINRGGTSIMEQIAKEGYDPTEYIRWYNLRTYDRINAPDSLIKKMETNSGTAFHEAMVSLAKVWVGGETVGGSTEDETVNIKIPVDEQGEVNQMEQTEGGKIAKKVNMPATVDEALDTIARFEDGAPRDDAAVADNVGQHALADKSELTETRWLGTEEEELDAFVTELCYIHSKLMIVDDRRVICGSANLNDRSMCGDRDSEIALVVEDMDMFETQMNGKKYQSSRFATQWRHQLMKEHLGLLPPQGTHPNGEEPKPEMQPSPNEHTNFLDSEVDRMIEDPLSDEFQELWNGTAAKNRKIFNDVFRTTPTDEVRSWADYHKFIPDGIPAGHVADRSLSVQQLKEKLNQIKGHLVEMPLQFLIEEKDLLSSNDYGINPVTRPIYL